MSLPYPEAEYVFDPELLVSQSVQVRRAIIDLEVAGKRLLAALQQVTIVKDGLISPITSPVVAKEVAISFDQTLLPDLLHILHVLGEGINTAMADDTPLTMIGSKNQLENGVERIAAAIDEIEGVRLHLGYASEFLDGQTWTVSGREDEFVAFTQIVMRNTEVEK